MKIDYIKFMKEINKSTELLAKVSNRLWRLKAEGAIVPDMVFDVIKEEADEYLQQVHASQYIGLDDDMPDDYEAWLAQQLEDNDILATLIN